MSRIYNALIELVAAAVFIIPLWGIYEKFFFQSWKRTMVYMIFGFYLAVVLALVGFPNITMLQTEFTVNLIPFIYMLSDFVNACILLARNRYAVREGPAPRTISWSIRISSFNPFVSDDLILST